jgi:hypothetical protein
MFKLKWTTMDGRKVERVFETDHERVLFVNTLYINGYDKYGKISMSRPTKRTLDAAKVWALVKS